MLRPLPALLLLLAACAVPAFAADATTPPPPPADGAAPPPPPPAAGEGNGQGQGRNGWMQRMIANNPELKGVDPNTPEGQDKIRQFMQAQMEKNAPQMRQRMAENQAAQHTELKKSFAMKDEEFTAIEPLLSKVESLRMQKGMVDRSGGPGGPGGFGGRRGGGMMDPKLLLGDTPMEPTVQEIQDALKALKALIDDPQANATETTAAVGRLRKARAAYQAVLTKAEEELRSVLSQRQEAILVDRGTLE